MTAAISAHSISSVVDFPVVPIDVIKVPESFTATCRSLFVSVSGPWKVSLVLVGVRKQKRELASYVDF